MMERWFGPCCLSVLAVACGGPGKGGAGPGGDASVSVPDGGSPPFDATLPPGDAGPPTDATSPADAGPIEAATTGDAATAGDGAIVDAADAGGLDLSSQDITFFAFGDPQFGGGPADKNSFQIQALNVAPSLAWPTDAGFVSSGVIGDPRGVIIAGDLTQNGQSGRDPFREWYTGAPYRFNLATEYGVDAAVPIISAELGLFVRDYGLRGNDGKDPFVLKYRVFEGYGNHDFDTLTGDPSADPGYNNEAPARDIVSLRNQVRATWPELRRFAPGNAGHYSWNWDQTHFVHLNLVGSDQLATNFDDAGGSQVPRDPQGALTFLQEDLAAEVGGSCRPVIIAMHYGFDPFSEEGRWWDEAQRLSFLAVLKPYNVAAIIHGHVHETNAYTMWDDTGKPYNVFSLGSPYYQGQATNGGRGHFQVFHLKGSHLDAADISWLPANPNPSAGDNVDLWTGKKLADVGFQITSAYSGGWGGWAFSRDLDVQGCQTGTPTEPAAGIVFCPDGGAKPPLDAGANLMINQPDPSTQGAEGFAFDWDDSWGSPPDPAYVHMSRASVCGAPGTRWQETGVPTGGWIKILPDNRSANASQLYFVSAPLLGGRSYAASVTMVGSGAYHLNVFDGSKDNAGPSVTLAPDAPTTLTVPFVMSSGTPELQVRIDGNDGSGKTSVDVTLWNVGIYAH